MVGRGRPIVSLYDVRADFSICMMCQLEGRRVWKDLRIGKHLSQIVSEHTRRSIDGCFIGRERFPHESLPGGLVWCFGDRRPDVAEMVALSWTAFTLWQGL
jgi:hypothetical protein